MSLPHIDRLIEIFFLFIAPVLVVKFYRGNPRYRLFIFFLVVVAAGIDAFYHLRPYQMGIRIDNILEASFLYMPFVVVSVFVLWLCSRLLHTKRITPWRNDSSFVLFAIFLSVGQQFLYQGVLLQRLSSEYSIPLAIFITALLYGFLHILFPRPLLSFFLTFLGGIMFATLFTMQPNLFVASVAHIILNITAIQFSFVAFVDESGSLERVI